MPEHLLYGAEVRPAAQHVRREGVPKRVRRSLALQAGRLHVLVHDPPYAPCAQPFAAVVQEYRFLFLGVLAGYLDVVLHRIYRLVAHWHYTLLVALAHHPGD